MAKGYKKRLGNITLSSGQASALKQAVLDSSPVSGLTHNFYRYPARFSPNFVRTTIQLFSKPGDLILDPFVGGGTSLVEARALGRRAVGIDINSLATFISETKTSILSRQDIDEISRWLNRMPSKLNLRNVAEIDEGWESYFRNIECKNTWPIRKSIQLALNHVPGLSSSRQQNFARCAILKTAQWALDSNKYLPSASDFREKFIVNSAEMLHSASIYSRAVKKADKGWVSSGQRKQKILHRTAIGIEEDKRLHGMPKPKLIVTSPPYPGVHVLYHRWQVNGRRETPAPYWIANKLDGSGASHYTFGDRQEEKLTSYFENTYKNFRSLANIADRQTTLVQMIAFSDPSWQLPLYLEVLQEAGFCEQIIPSLANSKDGRLWRDVPNRKWHANYKGNTPSSKEVVLFHKLK